MDRMKKRLLKLTTLILSALMLSGCWNSRELDNLSIVMGFGIDKSEKEDMVDVTAQLAIIQSGDSGTGTSGSQKSQGDSFWNIKGTGENLFSIMRDLTHQTSRKLYAPHNQVVIFGYDFAKEGVRDYIDLLLRDHETRLTVYVLVARGKASDIFEVKPKLQSITSLAISELIETQGATSETPQVRLMDFFERLISETTAQIAPIIYTTQDGEEEVLKVAGTAVFKQGSLVGELDNTQTRGLLWVLGQVNSGALTVEAPGGSAELEIISAQSSVNIELNDDGSISANIKIIESGNIAGQKGSGDLSDPENVLILKQNAQYMIGNEVMLCVEKAKELDADVFGFGEMVYKKYPAEWKNLKDNWDELFKTIKVTVEVDASIRGSGRIIKPAYPLQEE